MIPHTMLLPPLSSEDAAVFQDLAARHKAGKALVSSFNRDARVARKRELREALKTAPKDKLLSIGAELETLDTAFDQARHGAKKQLRALASAYVEFFPRLINNCEARADDLIASATAEYEKHFVPFGVAPVGVSPLVTFLNQWKQTLAGQRAYLDLLMADGATPTNPAAILPYPETAITPDTLL
jgi:hypothetical protein